jgi:hypothetical protein
LGDIQVSNMDGKSGAMHSKSSQSIFELPGFAAVTRNGRRKLGVALRSLCVFFATLSVVSMLGCVAIDATAKARVWSFNKTTSIHIAVPTKNTEFNIHYAGWVTISDGYDLTIPRGRASISADEIELKRNSKGGDTQLIVGKDSVVTISGSTECTVVLKILDEMGKEYTFNGSYTDQMCKR